MSPFIHDKSTSTDIGAHYAGGHDLPRCAESGEPVEPIPVIPFKCEPVVGMRARLNLAVPANARRSRPERALVWALAAFGTGVLIGAILS